MRILVAAAVGVALAWWIWRRGFPHDGFEPPAPASQPHTFQYANEPLEHIAEGTCWCQPYMDEKPDGTRVFIHKRWLDRAS